MLINEEIAVCCANDSKYKLLHILFFIINNKCTINIIQVYITTGSLCNLYCCMFRHFRVIIRKFTTNALLSYILIFKLQLLKTQFHKIIDINLLATDLFFQILAHPVFKM